MDDAREVTRSSCRKFDNIQTDTLEALRYLGNGLEIHRIRAALNLLRRLYKKSYSPKDGSEQEKNEVDYVLERLVRGVGASRDNARTGNFAALVSMLTIFPDIPVKDVLALVKRELSKGKGVSKSEAADIHMGQVLVYGALIKSGRFLQATVEEQVEILTNIITAGSKRTYLTLVAYTFVIESLNQVKKNKKLFKNVVLPIIQENAGMNKSIKDQSLDEIYLLLALRTHFPSIAAKSNAVLDPSNLPQCASILVNIPNISYIKHPVYEEYCKYIASTELVPLFWHEIEKQLSKQNRNRRLVTLEMLRHLFNHLQDKTLFPSFVSPALLSLILKSKSSKRHPMDDSMCDVFSKVKEIFPVLMSNILNEAVSDKTKVEVLRQFLFHPGNFMIEKNTGFRIVQPITTSLGSKGVKELAKVYRKVVSGKLNAKEESSNEGRKPDFKVLPWKNKERIYAAQLLARLVGIPVMANEHDWKFEQAKFLLHWGVFNKQLGPSEFEDVGVVGLEVSHALRESFFRCLDHKAGGVAGAIQLLLKIVRHVDALLNDDHVEEKALKGKALEDWQSAILVINKLENQVELDHSIESKPKGKVGETEVFVLLFLQLALQLFDWDAKLAAESLADLTACYTKLKQEKQQKMAGSNGEAVTVKKKDPSKAVSSWKEDDVKVNGESEDDPAWVEVIVDLFLHLLSQNRHLLRSMISSVFAHLCPYLTPAAFHSIIQVLVPQLNKNPLNGQDEDSDDSGSSDEMEEESNEESDSIEGGDAGESEEISGSISGDEDQPTVNETLRLAVQKALGTSAPTSDTESLDVDEIGEEEGHQLDAALSDAFRLLKDTKDIRKAKKLQSKDEKSLTHFRVRVIDLLEIFMDSNPPMSLCCDLVLPLFETLEFCIRELHQKPLETRVRTCFKKFSSIKSFSSTEGMDIVILCDLLKALLDKGSKTAPIYLEMSNEVVHCCTFVVRASEYLRKENEKMYVKKLKKSTKPLELQNSDITDLFKMSLETFFTRRDCLLPVGMFRQALQQPWSGCWCLVPILIQYGYDSSVRPFRRNQALQLLTTFFLNQSIVSKQDSLHQEELLLIKKEICSLSKKTLLTLVDSKESLKGGKKCLISLMGLLQAIKSSEDCGKTKNELVEGEEETSESVTASKGMDWEDFGTILTNIYCGGMRAVGPEAKRTVGKMLKLLGLTNVITRHQNEKQQRGKEALNTSTEENVKVKEEVTDDVRGEEKEGEALDKDREKREKKRKRKKASKLESRKLKKEAKEFRMQEFSKGLEDSCFPDIALMPQNIEVDGGAQGASDVLGSCGKPNKKRKSEGDYKELKRIKSS